VAAALRHRTAGAGPAVAGPERFWAPCLAVALLAMFLFYVTLQGLVKESAARAAVQPVAAARSLPSPVESFERIEPLPAVMPVRAAVAMAPAVPRAEAVPVKAAPAVVEVTKCLSPSGEASETSYSDGPCPEGSRASTLRLPRNMNVATATALQE
jgi:hypothetical protein